MDSVSFLERAYRMKKLRILLPMLLVAILSVVVGTASPAAAAGYVQKKETATGIAYSWWYSSSPHMCMHHMRFYNKSSNNVEVRHELRNRHFNGMTWVNYQVQLSPWIPAGAESITDYDWEWGLEEDFEGTDEEPYTNTFKRYTTQKWTNDPYNQSGTELDPWAGVC